MKTNRLYNFFKSSIIYAFGTIGCKLVSFLLLPLNTANLTPAEYGTADLIIVIVSLLLPISTLEVGTGVYKFLLSDQKETREEVITNGILLLLISTSIISLITLMISNLMNLDYGNLLFILVFVGSFRVSLLPISRGLNFSKNYAISGIISTIVTVLTNIFLIKYTSLRVEAILLASTFADISLSIYLICSTKLLKYIKFNLINFEIIKALLKFSVPIIPNSFSWWIDNSLAKVILNRNYGERENGYLAVAQKFPNLFNSLFSVLSLAWNDVTIKDENSEDKTIFQSTFMSEMLFMIMQILILAIIGIKIVYPFLIDERYYISLKYVPVFLIATAISSYADLFTSFFLSSGNTKFISLTSLSSSLVGLLFSIFFIPIFGIWGMAISLLTSKLLVFISRLWIIQKNYFVIKFGIKHLIMAMFLTFIVFQYYLVKSYALEIILFILVMAILLVLNREKIKMLLRFLKGENK